MENKRRFKKDMEIMGGFVKQYFIPYILMMILVSVFEIIFIVYWFMNVKTYSTRNLVYLFAYFSLLLASFVGIILLVLFKKNKFSLFSMSLILHFFCSINGNMVNNYNYIRFKK